MPSAPAHPVVTIARVEWLDAAAERPGLLFGLDAPAAGDAREGYTFLVIGWVLDPAIPAVTVDVFCGDEVVGWAPVTWLRPDIGALRPDCAHAGYAGFKLTASVVGLPRDFECVVEVVFEDLSRCRIAVIWGHAPRLECAHPPRLRPLHVTLLMRTGGSYLLELLAAHPNLVTSAWGDDRISGYWLQVLKVLCRPANHDRSIDRDNVSHDPHRAGQNPFNLLSTEEPAAVRRWLDRGAVLEAAEFCRHNIDEHYWLYATSQGRSDARYFVEKRNPRGAPADLIAQLYPDAREIFLVRDPRDMLVSILAFNAQRGWPGFGRADVATDEEYVGVLAEWVNDLLREWREREQRSLLVRYEDLVADPAACLTRIVDYLGVRAEPPLLDAIVSAASRSDLRSSHGTSPSVPQSVGRWRHELPPALREKSARAFAASLSAFGYAAELP